MSKWPKFPKKWPKLPQKWPKLPQSSYVFYDHGHSPHKWNFDVFRDFARQRMALVYFAYLWLEGVAKIYFQTHRKTVIFWGPSRLKPTQLEVLAKDRPQNCLKLLIFVTFWALFSLFIRLEGTKNDQKSTSQNHTIFSNLTTFQNWQKFDMSNTFHFLFLHIPKTPKSGFSATPWEGQGAQTCHFVQKTLQKPDFCHFFEKTWIFVIFHHFSLFHEIFSRKCVDEFGNTFAQKISKKRVFSNFVFLKSRLEKDFGTLKTEKMRNFMLKNT